MLIWLMIWFWVKKIRCRLIEWSVNLTRDRHLVKMLWNYRHEFGALHWNTEHKICNKFEQIQVYQGSTATHFRRAVGNVIHCLVGLPTFDFSIPGHRRTIEGAKRGRREVPERRGVGCGEGRRSPYPAWVPGAVPRKILEISVAKSRILMHFAYFCVHCDKR